MAEYTADSRDDSVFTPDWVESPSFAGSEASIPREIGAAFEAARTACSTGHTVGPSARFTVFHFSAKVPTAVCSRLLTVPNGMPSTSAISL